MIPPAPKGYRVIASHPSKQSIAYRIPYGAQVNGLEVEFLTGLYHKPGEFPFKAIKLLPDGLKRRCHRLLERRRLEGLDPRSVVSVSGPWPEIANRVFRTSRHADRLHDWLASRWLRRNLRGGEKVIVHGFTGSCRRTFDVAKALGARTVLEMTSPLWKETIMAPAYAELGLRFPEAGPTTTELEELRLADFVVTQSPFAADFLQRHGLAGSRLFTLPMGVDIKLFHPRQRPREQTTFRALFVGTPSLRKGFHLLLQAWRELALPDAELVIAGRPNEPHGARLLKGAAAICRHAGHLPHGELATLYREADIFVFPGFCEGGPLVALEALASGLPCVVTEGARSVVRDGVDGYVLPNGDLESLKERILRLYSEPELRARMATAARDRAEGFTWSNYYRRLGQVYGFVAAGGHPRQVSFDMSAC